MLSNQFPLRAHLSSPLFFFIVIFFLLWLPLYFGTECPFIFHLSSLLSFSSPVALPQNVAVVRRRVANKTKPRPAWKLYNDGRICSIWQNYTSREPFQLNIFAPSKLLCTDPQPHPIPLIAPQCYIHLRWHFLEHFNRKPTKKIVKYKRRNLAAFHVMVSTQGFLHVFKTAL